ncbi:MAG: hypothetical protein BEN18_04770 [Epulopiscium sp. Nuni2H_MBin001]|nr:MAG: hypothetical protein BEN18_04770 [Epulopiscium sp. Nuni2H_MBin001]
MQFNIFREELLNYIKLNRNLIENKDGSWKVRGFEELLEGKSPFNSEEEFNTYWCSYTARAKTSILKE